MENILNIINFVRGCEPRDPGIDLVEPVREQIALLKKHGLPGTFLLQYDAMEREDIVSLLRPLDPEQFELGIWMEMNRPHAAAAGLPWRGRPGFDWDWHANVGFTVGYTPREREALVDAIIGKFRATFHREPASVGSWMLDAHTLGYLSDRYSIVASCNCKDQWGTDGYTIWGGYWNQGYYPSRSNALCPAQHASQQIPLPVFRMLGSDPVTQYDLGLTDAGPIECQHVASLEPVYSNAGANAAWVDWFARQNFGGNSLAFAYAQAGQENSFGWPAMREGLTYQFSLFAAMREKGLRVERLMDTGRWYRERFATTPATAVCALEPFGQRNAQSIWYDCKNYRANLYHDQRGARIRDLFLFDERYEERYLREVCETEYLVYDNLPVIDGNRMSGGGILAGGWLVDAAGAPILTPFLEAREEGNGILARLETGSIALAEEEIRLSGGLGIQLRWARERGALQAVEERRLSFAHRGMRYALLLEQGIAQPCEGGALLLPQDGELRLRFARE